MEKISRNQENFIIMTVIYDEIADQTAGQSFRDVDEIISEITENPIPPANPSPSSSDKSWLFF